MPLDATQVELWFENFSQTSTRCDAWDSRYGQNYWFGVGGPPPRFPTPQVSYRTGAITQPEMVMSQQAMKINAFVQNPPGSRGFDLQTRLDVAAWVRESRYGAGAWIDLHVFDAGDQLIQASTIGLPYTGFGPFPQFGFSGVVYARTLQYRLYYTVDYQLFTDGVLRCISSLFLRMRLLQADPAVADVVVSQRAGVVPGDSLAVIALRASDLVVDPDDQLPTSTDG